jgi:glycosyltransferase involved in cell wall biosynthesis
LSAPRVSVLLPVRDAAPYLEACIRSVGRQSFTGFEVVTVDDGSSDGSGARLDAWARSDPRVVVLHRPAAGLVAALNTGLEACRAGIVARMDADDAAHPRRLEEQVRLLDRHPEVGVASCMVCHVPVHRVGEGARLYARWLNHLLTHADVMRERFVESPIAHPSAVVRRGLLERIGGYRDVGWPEDYDLWLRLAEAGAVFAKVPRVLYFWRDHADRLTRRDYRYAKEMFLRCKAHFLARGPLAGGRPVIVWGAGPTGRRLARALEGEDVRPAAFVDIDPAKVGRVVRGQQVHPPGKLADLLGPDTVVLAAVASRGARDEIRKRLRGLGLVEGEGFWCAS